MTRLVPIRDLTTHPQPHVRVSQIARYLQVDKRTVTKWIEAGLMQALRLPTGHWRIATADVRRFVAAMHLRPEPPPVVTYRDIATS